MYTEILKELADRIRELDKQIAELSGKRQQYIKALEVLRKLQAEEDAKAGRLAVQRGVCPFPNSCDEREYCTRDHCDADTCTNGYAYRMS